MIQRIAPDTVHAYVWHIKHEITELAKELGVPPLAISEKYDNSTRIIPKDPEVNAVYFVETYGGIPVFIHSTSGRHEIFKPEYWNYMQRPEILERAKERLGLTLSCSDLFTIPGVENLYAVHRIPELVEELPIGQVLDIKLPDGQPIVTIQE